jgi:hypothetical protein
MNPLESLQTDLGIALAEKEKLERRIAAIEQSIKLLEPVYQKELTRGGLYELAELGDIKNLGLTAAIERVLMSAKGHWMPPTSVRNGLKEAGFGLTGDNPLAAIHQTLRRLAERQNSPVVSAEIQGQRMYRFDMDRLARYTSTYAKAFSEEKKI